MIVYDLGPDAVLSMIRVDLAAATEEPPSQVTVEGGCGDRVRWAIAGVRA